MTTLDNKIQILNDFYIEFGSDGVYADFIEVHDLGLPLAVLITQGHALATESGITWIHDDFTALCEELGVDRHGDYESLDDMLEIAEYPDAEG